MTKLVKSLQVKWKSPQRLEITISNKADCSVRVIVLKLTKDLVFLEEDSESNVEVREDD